LRISYVPHIFSGAGLYHPFPIATPTTCAPAVDDARALVTSKLEYSTYADTFVHGGSSAASLTTTPSTNAVK
jgi:hypothetical protein